MAYKVSPETAKRVLAAIEHWDTPEHAAHQTSIGLVALGHYTDSASERVLTCLNRITRLDDAKRGQWITALAEISAS